MLFLRTDAFIAILLVAISFTAFFYVVTSDLGGFAKGMVAILLLLLTGMVIRHLTHADGWNGFIMLRVKEGMSLIRWFKKVFGGFWEQVCDIGLVVGFGLSSKAMFKHISNRLLIVSLIVLAVFEFIILPYLAIITLTIMDLPRADSVTQAQSLDNGSGNITLIAGVAVLALFGLVGIVGISLLSKALSIILSVIGFLAGDATALAGASPGVSFIIPGLTIPLFEGIIALFVLLVVHEGSHGIAALLAKVKLKSTGFLLFGFIPVGAFVDINEKQLNSKRAVDKLRVAVAGSAANLTATFVFFIPTLLMLSVLPTFFENQLTVAGFWPTFSAEGANITAGTVVTEINGMPVSNLTDYKSVKGGLIVGQDVILTTDKGAATVKVDSSKTLGLLMTQPVKPEFWWAKFIYSTLGLITVLNFFIGVINLLPVPTLDGHRIVGVSVKNKRALNAIAYLFIAALLLNILPWIWR